MGIKAGPGLKTSDDILQLKRVHAKVQHQPYLVHDVLRTSFSLLSDR